MLLYCFIALLAAYTLSTWDGGELSSRIISAAVLLVAALRLSGSPNQGQRLRWPVSCLVALAAYGALQTIFFKQKIVSAGWTGVLFWLTAAAITFLGSELGVRPVLARRFLLWLAVFGTAVCLLDVLQQASQTNRYFWLVSSRYHSIFGPFAYWNNFAQFVELVLPVTLWQGLGGERVRVAYLFFAAIQISAVVASGSRAGTLLATLELVTVIVIVCLQRRSRRLLLGGLLAIGLSIAFVYAAGFQTIIGKLQTTDQLAVRRNIDRSSVAMIRERPLTGWGLETYVPVYRMFALYDDGTYVNRAHNDWLEWAAEGGILFSAAMLAVALWAFRPAIRSGWALGLIAMSLHALVDYPFARFGVCGWYFCLLGMLSRRASLLA